MQPSRSPRNFMTNIQEEREEISGGTNEHDRMFNHTEEGRASIPKNSKQTGNARSALIEVPVTERAFKTERLKNEPQDPSKRNSSRPSFEDFEGGFGDNRL